MNPTAAALALATFCASASAQYKCVTAGGAVSFQQTPCAAQQKQEALHLPPAAPPPAPPSAPAPMYVLVPVAPPPAPASAPVETSPDKRLLAQIEKSRRDQSKSQRIADLEGRIRGLESSIARRNAEMEADAKVAQRERRPIGSRQSESDWAHDNAAAHDRKADALRNANSADLLQLQRVQQALDDARREP